MCSLTNFRQLLVLSLAFNAARAAGDEERKGKQRYSTIRVRLHGSSARSSFQGYSTCPRRHVATRTGIVSSQAHLVLPARVVPAATVPLQVAEHRRRHARLRGMTLLHSTEDHKFTLRNTGQVKLTASQEIKGRLTTDTSWHFIQQMQRNSAVRRILCLKPGYLWCVGFSFKLLVTSLYPSTRVYGLRLRLSRLMG